MSGAQHAVCRSGPFLSVVDRYNYVFVSLLVLVVVVAFVVAILCGGVVSVCVGGGVCGCVGV